MTNLNSFGVPFKTKKSLFMDLDWLKKGASHFKKETMPPIQIQRKRVNPVKQLRKASRRQQRKAKEYNASCSNHDADLGQNFRVKLSSIKSYSKVDNSIAVDTFDKFFRIFKKKKKHLGQSREEKPNKSTPNIYKYPRSRFKSFRQLTMQRHSKRTGSRPFHKNREQSLDRGTHAEMRMAEEVFQPKPKRQSNFYKKKLWPEEQAELGENIYRQQGRNGKTAKRTKKHRQKMCRKIEGDVEKFHREYIKIDCMESDSGSEVSNFRAKRTKNRPKEVGEPGRKHEIDFENERVVNFEHEMYENNRKLKQKEDRNNIYTNKNTDGTNLSCDSLEGSGEAHVTSEKGRLESGLRSNGKRRQKENSRAESRDQNQKIKKVRLIDSYNLGFLYEHSSPKANAAFAHSQTLKLMLNQKRPKRNVEDEKRGELEDSRNSQKIVVENLSQDWNSDFQDGEQALDFIKIEHESNSSVHLENISLQKSISVAMQPNTSPKAAKPFLYKNSFVIGKDEIKLSESERKPRNEESNQQLVNYESEKSFRNRFKKPGKFQLDAKRKKASTKRRSEHGIPLKMSSLREKKLKMKLRKKAEMSFPLWKPAKKYKRTDARVEGKKRSRDARGKTKG